jgi:hypothetical protein
VTTSAPKVYYAPTTAAVHKGVVQKGVVVQKGGVVQKGAVQKHAVQK